MDEETIQLREEVSSLKGTVLALEMMLWVAFLGICKGQSRDFVEDILGTLDDLPGRLVSRYDFDAVPGMKSNVEGTIRDIASRLRSNLDL